MNDSNYMSAYDFWFLPRFWNDSAAKPWHSGLVIRGSKAHKAGRAASIGIMMLPGIKFDHMDAARGIGTV